MSARVPLITFAIINLLCLFGTVQIQCQASDYSEQVGSAADERWQQQQQQQQQEQSIEPAKEQQGLQLILSKLIPSLWPAAQIGPDQNQQTATTTNQYHTETGGGGPSAGYQQQHWQQAPAPTQIGQVPGAAADAAGPAQSGRIGPTRQLISAHSNQLFYPPGEQEQPGQPQLQPQLQQHQQQQPSRSQASNNHYSSYSMQQPPHQSVGAWQPSGGSAQSIAGYRPSYQQANWQPQMSGAATDSGGPLHLLTGSNWQQQQQHQQHSLQSTAGSALLAFLANNKANLSNLIQLLPLIAQTISILPKVFQGSAGLAASGLQTALATPNTAASASGAGHHESPSQGEPLASGASQLVMSLLQSGATNQSNERLSEQPQSGNSNENELASGGGGGNKVVVRPIRPNNGEQHRDWPANGGPISSQASMTGLGNSLLGELLPQITRHLLFNLLKSAINGNGGGGGGGGGGGVAAELAAATSQRQNQLQGPLVSYLLEPQPATPSPAPQRPATHQQPGTLAWLRGLIGSLASSAGFSALSQARHAAASQAPPSLIEQQQLHEAASNEVPSSRLSLGSLLNSYWLRNNGANLHRNRPISFLGTRAPN